MSTSLYPIVAAATGLITLLLLLVLFAISCARIKRYGTPAMILAGAFALYALVQLTSFIVPTIAARFVSSDGIMLIYAINSVISSVLHGIALLLFFMAVFSKRAEHIVTSNDLGRSESQSENPYQP